MEGKVRKAPQVWLSLGLNIVIGNEIQASRMVRRRVKTMTTAKA